MKKLNKAIDILIEVEDDLTDMIDGIECKADMRDSGKLTEKEEEKRDKYEEMRDVVQSALSELEEYYEGYCNY